MISFKVVRFAFGTIKLLTVLFLILYPIKLVYNINNLYLIIFSLFVTLPLKLDQYITYKRNLKLKLALKQRLLKDNEKFIIESYNS